MNQFAKSIQDQLRKATGQSPPWGDVNPLVMIGLTEAILDLGLNEAQMYPVVRSFLRQLAAQVHPDRNPKNVSAVRQNEILAALNYLDDRDNFSRALDDFRTIKAEDRREVKILSQAVRALRRQAEEVDNKEVAVRQEKEALAAQRTAFRKLQLDEPLKVPGLEHEVKELTDNLQRSRRFGREEEKHHQKWLNRYGQIEQYILNLGSDPWLGPPFHPFAFDAKWVVVAFLSHTKIEDKEKKDETKEEKEVRIERQREQKEFVHSWTFFAKNEEVRPEFVDAIRAANIPIECVSEIGVAWSRASERLQEEDESKQGVKALTIAVIGLSGGYPKLYFGDRRAAIGRVIGSMAPHKKPLLREDFRQQNRTGILEKTIPFLIPGRLLVSVVRDHRENNSNPPLESLFDSSLFYTRREILAAG